MKNKLLVSACLMRFQVRYNGSEKAQLAATLSRWQQAGRLVIHCPELKEGEVIPFSAVERVRPLADRAEFLLFHTGWGRYWGTERYFGGYPCIDQGIVDYLLQSGKKGVGLDTIGVDPIADAYLSIHRRLFQDHDLVVMENLANLDQLGDGLFTLFALPLRYQDADGSPIRAVAVLDGEE